ncbi:QuiP [Pseudomonas aeruginosa]|nr:QuiP [Pseudomonas aeruginosa]
MASPAFMRFLPRCGAAAAFGTLLGLAGCQSWLDDRYADSLPPTSGVQPIKGLAQKRIDPAQRAGHATDRNRHLP